MSKLMGKFMGYVIGTLLGIIAVLASSLALFLAPLFQTDELLAQIRVENVEQIADKTCFIVSLDVTPGNDDTKRKTILERQPYAEIGSASATNLRCRINRCFS